MKPPKIFLSYSRKDIDDIKIIAKCLMAHGIKTWQDINNLGAGLTEDKIRKAIQRECTGLVFYSTRASVKSKIICNIELPEAEDRYKKNPSFNIVPIFKLGPRETTKALKGYLTIPLSNFNGALVKNGKKLDILTASHRASHIILNEARLNAIKPLPIGLASKQKTTAPVALDLDFTQYFLSGLPSQKIWVEEFYPTLESFKKALVNKKILHMRLYSFAHLSLGFLFGYIFRQRSGFELEIEQLFPSGGRREIWSTNNHPAKNPLLIKEFPGEIGSTNLCINLNLMSKDNSSFSKYIKKSRLSYRALLELTPSKYPCVISNGQAIKIAAQMANSIKKLNAKYGTNTVHIFAAIPLGLALLAGHHLNACGKIQCYEFDNVSRQYSPSCILA